MHRHPNLVHLIAASAASAALAMALPACADAPPASPATGTTEAALEDVDQCVDACLAEMGGGGTDGDEAERCALRCLDAGAGDDDRDDDRDDEGDREGACDLGERADDLSERCADDPAACDELDGLLELIEERVGALADGCEAEPERCGELSDHLGDLEAELSELRLACEADREDCGPLFDLLAALLGSCDTGGERCTDGETVEREDEVYVCVDGEWAPQG